jgi:two-component sensor histidine kinase
VDEEHMDEYNDIMSEIFEKHSISSREVKRVRKDGTERYFRLHVSNITQEVDQMMVLLEDITKEKEYEMELEKNLEEKNILLAEIHHRVKNNLAIILGLIELQSVDVSDELAQSLLVKTRNRIHSISGIHEMLYQNESFSDISFEEYVKKLVKRLQHSYENEDRPVQIQLDADNLRINMNRAVPLGLLLNELITNSYKHAFKNIDDPVIEISFKRQNGNVQIEYRDNGPGFDSNKMEYSKSLGLTLIKTSLMQLEADYTISNTGGFSIVLNFPAELKNTLS